jgi:hypothetical protein
MHLPWFNFVFFVSGLTKPGCHEIKEKFKEKEKGGKK